MLRVHNSILCSKQAARLLSLGFGSNAGGEWVIMLHWSFNTFLNRRHFAEFAEVARWRQLFPAEIPLTCCLFSPAFGCRAHHFLKGLFTLFLERKTLIWASIYWHFWPSCPSPSDKQMCWMGQNLASTYIRYFRWMCKNVR